MLTWEQMDSAGLSIVSADEIAWGALWRGYYSGTYGWGWALHEDSNSSNITFNFTLYTPFAGSNIGATFKDSWTQRFRLAFISIELEDIVGFFVDNWHAEMGSVSKVKLEKRGETWKGILLWYFMYTPMITYYY